MDTELRSTELRSAAWFGASGKVGFVHRSHTRSEGFPDHLFTGRPVIAILTSWSELAPCNAHLHDLAQSVKAGVYEAGGFPLEAPVMGLGETLLRPTAMLYRNLAAMEAEEVLRANPVDGAVLLAGCDKTTPALVMGAASADLPAILVTGGPMVNGRFCGRVVGSGTDVWRFAEDVRAGLMTPGRDGRGRVRRVARRGPLHDDGHRLHDGLSHRSHGPSAPRIRRGPGR